MLRSFSIQVSSWGFGEMNFSSSQGMCLPRTRGSCPVLFVSFLAGITWSAAEWIPEPFAVLLNLGHSEAEGCWLAPYLRVSKISYGRRRMRIPMPKFLFLKEVSVVPLHVRAGSDHSLHISISFSEAAPLWYLKNKSLFCQWGLLHSGVRFRASHGGLPAHIT